MVGLVGYGSCGWFMFSLVGVWLVWVGLVGSWLAFFELFGSTFWVGWILGELRGFCLR